MLWRDIQFIVILISTLLITIPSTLNAVDLLTFKLIVKDGRFYPDCITVPVGQKIKIIIHNIGKTVAEFESIELHKEKVLAPGAQSFIVIAPLRLGKYKFYDDFHLNMPPGLIVAQ